MVLTLAACGPKAKATGVFDSARRLLPLLATFGVLLAMAGAASLFGRAPALGELNATPMGSAIILAVGLLFLYFGVCAVASLPPPLAAIAGTEHLPAPDEKTRLSSARACAFSRARFRFELGKLAALRGG